MFLGRIRNRLQTNAGNARLFAEYLLRERRLTEDGRRTVFFDVGEPRLERYLYWLLKMFDIAGWNVSLRASPNLLLNLRNHADYIYDIKNLEIRMAKAISTDLVISDKLDSSGSIFLDADYFSSEKKPNSFDLPFSMYPDVYHLNLNSEISKLRTREKTIRVFLGGNLSNVYDDPSMKKLFGIINRRQITDAVVEAFGGASNYFEIKNRSDAVEIIDGGTGPGLAVLKKNVLELSAWMKILASSQFFVAPPGYVMPFSHNMIEAMAVGSIPITQYGGLFSPPLIDGETCIYFHDLNDLKKKIESLLGLDEGEVETMRQRVIDYYDTHLEPTSVVNKIYKNHLDLNRIYIIAGHLSLANLRKGALSK